MLNFHPVFFFFFWLDTLLTVNIALIIPQDFFSFVFFLGILALYCSLIFFIFCFLFFSFFFAFSSFFPCLIICDQLQLSSHLFPLLLCVAHLLSWSSLVLCRVLPHGCVFPCFIFPWRVLIFGSFSSVQLLCAFLYFVKELSIKDALNLYQSPESCIRVHILPATQLFFDTEVEPERDRKCVSALYATPSRAIILFSLFTSLRRMPFTC